MPFANEVTVQFIEDYAQDPRNVDFTADAFKLALYEPGHVDKTTSVYQSTGELQSPNYVAGGNAVVVADTGSMDGNEFIYDFENVVFDALTGAVAGGLMYNTSRTNNTVLLIDFGRTVELFMQGLEIRMPTAAEMTAVLRLKGG